MGLHRLTQLKRLSSSDQCKEIEENNRMGKTRDLFKKMRDTKGTFHSKTGSIIFNLYGDYITRNVGWMKHNLELSMLGDISTTSDIQIRPLLWQKWRRTKEPLEESERAEWKSWLKTQHSKMNIMASGPITSWQIMEKNGNGDSLYFLGFQNHCKCWLHQ